MGTSQIIGRGTCPECEFEAAHVKQSDKCLYRYCPECGSQTIAKTDRQQANMKKHMRPLIATVPATVPATGSASGNGITPITPPVPEAPKRRGLFI